MLDLVTLPPSADCRSEALHEHGARRNGRWFGRLARLARGRLARRFLAEARLRRRALDVRRTVGDGAGIYRLLADRLVDPGFQNLAAQIRLSRRPDNGRAGKM